MKLHIKPSTATMAKTACSFLLVLVTVLAVSGQIPEFTKEDCELEPGPGPCPVLLIFNYYWDDSFADCVLDQGRCHKSRNNFRSRKECLRIAGRICFNRTRNDHIMDK